MQQVIYFTFVLVFIIASGHICCSEDTKKEIEFKFKRITDIYDLSKEASLQAKIISIEDDFERKKKGHKKGGKNNPSLDTDSLDFYPEPNIKPNSPVRPPLFPCDPPVCTVLQDPLPANICKNECEEDTRCQGRRDTRIEEEYIAVCVPDDT